MHPVRVVLVDDHEIVRAGVASLLARQPDIEVVGSASSGEAGIVLVRDLAPDILVVDYRMAGMSGIEVAERVRDEHPEVAVIVLTTSLDDEVVLRSLQAGVRAYVYKDVGAEELIRAVRAVAAGEAVLDPAVTARVIAWAGQRRFAPAEQVLTAREIDILRLVAAGEQNKEIATELMVSQNTVKTYLTRAMHKLGCTSRSEAVALASSRGLL